MLRFWTLIRFSTCILCRFNVWFAKSRPGLISSSMSLISRWALWMVSSRVSFVAAFKALLFCLFFCQTFLIYRFMVSQLIFTICKCRIYIFSAIFTAQNIRDLVCFVFSLNNFDQIGNSMPIPLMSPPDSEGKRHAIPKDVATLFRIMSPLRGRSEATLVFGCLS